jgi:hypothetical protein
MTSLHFIPVLLLTQSISSVLKTPGAALIKAYTEDHFGRGFAGKLKF